MPTTILLIRHGETAWNRDRIFRGAYDIPLNENGRLQARRLATALTPYRIDAAYTSPLCRATETAQIALATHEIDATVHQDLRDFDYGAWTSLEERTVAQEWPQEHALWLTEPHAARPPGGDTLQEVFERAFADLESIAGQHTGQTVALFAHRVVNKLLILGMMTLGLRRFPFIRQDNCCLNVFELEPAGYVVVRLNDTSHMRETGLELLETDF